MYLYTALVALLMSVSSSLFAGQSYMNYGPGYMNYEGQGYMNYGPTMQHEAQEYMAYENQPGYMNYEAPGYMAYQQGDLKKAVANWRKTRKELKQLKKEIVSFRSQNKNTLDKTMAKFSGLTIGAELSRMLKTIDAELSKHQPAGYAALIEGTTDLTNLRNTVRSDLNNIQARLKKSAADLDAEDNEEYMRMIQKYQE